MTIEQSHVSDLVQNIFILAYNLKEGTISLEEFWAEMAKYVPFNPIPSTEYIMHLPELQEVANVMEYNREREKRGEIIIINHGIPGDKPQVFDLTTKGVVMNYQEQIDIVIKKAIDEKRDLSFLELSFVAEYVNRFWNDIHFITMEDENEEDYPAAQVKTKFLQVQMQELKAEDIPHMLATRAIVTIGSDVYGNPIYQKSMRHEMKEFIDCLLDLIKPACSENRELTMREHAAISEELWDFHDYFMDKGYKTVQQIAAVIALQEEEEKKAPHN